MTIIQSTFITLLTLTCVLSLSPAALSQSAESGPNGTVTIITGSPDMDSIDSMMKSWKRKGGDGGSHIKTEADGSLTVVPGEEGKPDGSGGRGADPDHPGMIMHLSGTEKSLVIRINGYAAHIDWPKIEKLKESL